LLKVFALLSLLFLIKWCYLKIINTLFTCFATGLDYGYEEDLLAIILSFDKLFRCGRGRCGALRMSGLA
jgi:hypothetical protein